MAGVFDAITRNLSGGDAFDRSAKELHKHFINDINHLEDDGNNLPRIFSMDMKYNFRLQQQRAAAHGISIKRRYLLDEKSATAVSAQMGRDKRYVIRIPVTTCNYENTFLSGGKVLEQEKSNGIISSFVVFARNQIPNVTYCCPNCGDINSVAQLLEQGCRSCGTKFIMSELYPRITNFYTYKQKPYVNKRPLPYCIICIILTLAYSLFSFSKPPEIKIEYILSLPAAAFCGVIFGYILYAISMILQLIIDAVKSGPRDSAFEKTRKKLPRFMKKIDPFFSVDFFVSKVNNLLKTLVFSDNYHNCSVYEKDGENPYKDIIDVEYQGAIRLNKINSDEQYVYVDLDVFTKTTCIKNNRLHHRDELFHMKLCRSVCVQDDCNASVHNIECHSCGASFDAVREKNCPFCGNSYDLKNYDWVVTDFEKR